MRPHSFRFVGACPQLTRQLVNWITECGQPHGLTKKVTPQTFARWAEPGFVRGWREQYGVPLLSDPFIGFYKTRLPSGKPAYFFVWSRMEHLFVPGRFDLAEETRRAGELGYR